MSDHIIIGNVILSRSLDHSATELRRKACALGIPKAWKMGGGQARNQLRMLISMVEIGREIGPEPRTFATFEPLTTGGKP